MARRIPTKLHYRRLSQSRRPICEVAHTGSNKISLCGQVEIAARSDAWSLVPEKAQRLRFVATESQDAGRLLAGSFEVLLSPGFTLRIPFHIRLAAFCPQFPSLRR